MRLLITGATGFVGLNLVRNLAAGGRFSAILATDRLAASQDEAEFIHSPSTSFLPLDVTNRQAVLAVFERWRPTHVLHAAALTPGAGLSAEKTTQVFDVNLTGSINVFDAAARFGTQRVLLLSSSGVYALSGGSSRDEDDPLALEQPYGASKRAAEIASWSYTDHVEIVAARIGPIYGPMERVRPSRPRVSLIGQLTAAHVEGRRVRIAGTDVSRDWTFAADAADAIERLLTASHLRHRIYNVSSGRPHATSEVVAAFRSRGLDIGWSPPTQADITISPQEERTPLSIARLTADTGFAPRWSLDAGVAATLAAFPPPLPTKNFEESHS